ncbi:hypothetical protein HDE_12845 [Halotydeus destructor]|nr:hypothetical protein HDE_12845 [Halotydeus destructor]
MSEILTLILVSERKVDFTQIEMFRKVPVFILLTFLLTYHLVVNIIDPTWLMQAPLEDQPSGDPIVAELAQFPAFAYCSQYNSSQAANEIFMVNPEAMFDIQVQDGRRTVQRNKYTVHYSAYVRHYTLGCVSVHIKQADPIGLCNGQDILFTVTVKDPLRGALQTGAIFYYLHSQRFKYYPSHMPMEALNMQDLTSGLAGIKINWSRDFRYRNKSCRDYRDEETSGQDDCYNRCVTNLTINEFHFVPLDIVVMNPHLDRRMPDELIRKDIARIRNTCSKSCDKPDCLSSNIKLITHQEKSKSSSLHFDIFCPIH